MSRREQIKMSIKDISRYLKESRTIILVSNGKNGYPHPMPMWYAVDDENTVYMTTFKKSQKIENLNDEDRTYLHSIAKASNLLEKIDIPPPKRGETDELINKYNVMKGQILAGNDNKKMVQEFKESILR